MDEEKVENIDKIKQSKDPKQAAINKLREAVNKEYGSKIEAQVKKTMDAVKIANNEKRALTEMLEDHKEATGEFAEFLKEI